MTGSVQWFIVHLFTRFLPPMIYFKFRNSIDNVQAHCGEFSYIKTREPKNCLEVQADGDELAQACAILGRSLPPNRVYTFYGNNAVEIAANWG